MHFEHWFKTIWWALIMIRWLRPSSASQSNTGILRNKLFNQTIAQCLNGKLSVSGKINFWVEKHSTSSSRDFYRWSLIFVLRFVLEQNLLRYVSVFRWIIQFLAKQACSWNTYKLMEGFPLSPQWFEQKFNF